MKNKNNSYNRILKTFVITAAVLVICLLTATVFAQLGRSYEMLSAYATEEDTDESTAPAETTAPDTDDTENSPTATAESTSAPTVSPEESDDPDTTPGSTETPDADDSETSEPENSEGPDSDTTEKPSSTEEPSDVTGSIDPEGTAEGTPNPTESAIATSFPTSTARPTPSPTLAWLEAPYVSGDIYVDVEDENYTPTIDPQETASADTDSGDGMANQTARPETAVKDKGNLSIFFDVMVYIFIGCAVLTAGYAVFLGVKLFMLRQKSKSGVSATGKGEKSDE